MNKNIISTYWRCYGGFSSIFKSFYFWGALILTIILYPVWSAYGWWEIPLSLLPNMLGFSFGGFAIWMAMGDDEFRNAISGENDGTPSPYMEVNATFVHFLMLQSVSLILAIMAKCYAPLLHDSLRIIDALKMTYSMIDFLKIISSGLSYFIFTYALFSMIAMVLAIFRISTWYDAFKS